MASPGTPATQTRIVTPSSIRVAITCTILAVALLSFEVVGRCRIKTKMLSSIVRSWNRSLHSAVLFFCSVLFFLLCHCVVFLCFLFCSVHFCHILFFFSVIVLFCSAPFRSALLCCSCPFLSFSVLSRPVPFPFCPIQFRSVLFSSVLSYSVPFCPIQFRSIPFSSAVLSHSVPSYSVPFCPIQFRSVLFSSFLSHSVPFRSLFLLSFLLLPAFLFATGSPLQPSLLHFSHIFTPYFADCSTRSSSFPTFPASKGLIPP